MYHAYVFNNLHSYGHKKSLITYKPSVIRRRRCDLVRRRLEVRFLSARLHSPPWALLSNLSIKNMSQTKSADLSFFSERGAKAVQDVRRQAEPNEKDNRAALFGGSSLTPALIAPRRKKTHLSVCHAYVFKDLHSNGHKKIAHHIQAERYSASPLRLGAPQTRGALF